MRAESAALWAALLNYRSIAKHNVQNVPVPTNAFVDASGVSSTFLNIYNGATVAFSMCPTGSLAALADDGSCSWSADSRVPSMCVLTLL